MSFRYKLVYSSHQNITLPTTKGSEEDIQLLLSLGRRFPYISQRTLHSPSQLIVALHSCGYVFTLLISMTKHVYTHSALADKNFDAYRHCMKFDDF